MVLPGSFEIAPTEKVVNEEAEGTMLPSDVRAEKVGGNTGDDLVLESCSAGEFMADTGSVGAGKSDTTGFVDGRVAGVVGWLADGEVGDVAGEIWDLAAGGEGDLCRNLRNADRLAGLLAVVDDDGGTEVEDPGIFFSQWDVTTM